MWLGYALSVFSFGTAALLICLSGPFGYDFDSPGIISFAGFKTDLINRGSYKTMWSPMYATSAHIVIYNGVGPYFGSILGLPGPTTDHRIIALGVYFRWLGWDDGSHWLTMMISLWWLVVASLTYPLLRSLGIRRFRFSLRFAAVAMATVCVLFAFPFAAALLHPFFVAIAMTLAFVVKAIEPIVPRRAA